MSDRDREIVTDTGEPADSPPASSDDVFEQDQPHAADAPEADEPVPRGASFTDADLRDIELPPVPDDAPVDDDIAAMYEEAARRRAVRETGAARRGRPWWPFAAAAAAGIAIVAGGSWWGVHGASDLVAARTPGIAVARAADYRSIVPTGAVAAVRKAATAAPAPAGAPEAVARYALAYPDAPSVSGAVFGSLKPTRKMVAITLDDGIPFDKRILDLFEANDVRCTTFVLGTFVRSRPDLVRRMSADGFEIANHTWDHTILTHLSEAEVRSELSRTQREISKITGNQAPYMRPPGGGYNDKVERIAASMGFRIVMWNRSLADTSSHATAEQLYVNGVRGVRSGDIILCHWGRPYTYEALARIVPELKRLGFEIVTISEMLADSGGPDSLK